jgi:uncharacterized protein (TIGR02246 family)
LHFWRDARRLGEAPQTTIDEGSIVPTRDQAHTPEDLTRLFVERANAGDAAGVALLYEEDAVMAYPPGGVTVGRDAIRELFEQFLAKAPRFTPEPPLPTLISGELALTSTPPSDGAGARAQVVRRQPDGTWLRVLDQPEFVSPAR